MNQFEIEEAKLVNKIIDGLRSINWYGNNSAINDYVERMAFKGVATYVKGTFKHIAAINVMELVKEKLSAKH